MAFMAVVVVLTAYLGMVVHTASGIYDPVPSVDESILCGTVEDGAFIPGYADSLGDLLDRTGCRGISVSVKIPGGFCDGSGPLTVGDMDGRLFSKTVASSVTDNHGRTFPAFFEVTVCV